MNADATLPPILVADDNATDVFFLQRRLAAAGIANPLVHVEDGCEAITWLEQNVGPAATRRIRPWLVFVDLRMPRRDGFDVLQWIRDHGLGSRLTVVVLTTSDEPSDIERASQLGAHRFMVKYPAPADLMQVAALAMRRAIAGFDLPDEAAVSSFVVRKA